MYVEYLGKLSAIIEDYESSKVGIIGDFNAAVGTTFEGELLEVCTHHELIISDYEHFGRNSSQFTFVSDAHSTTSWLDHITMPANSYRTLYLLLHLLENQRKTWSNGVKTHTKPIYMNNTTLGSVAVGFEHTLMSFGHANS